jgi:hypothetical protein
MKIYELPDLMDQQSGCVRTFMDNIKIVHTLYKNYLEVMFDKNAVFPDFAWCSPVVW